MSILGSRSPFQHSVETVTTRRRYIRDKRTEQFLGMVRKTVRERCDLWPLGTELWRAQLGCDFKYWCIDSVWPGRDYVPYPADRMKPKRERAAEGRANPKGIPFLYLATDYDTAIGEVRPWVGSCVSVGLFRTSRKLKLVNCVTDPNVLSRIDKMSMAEQDEAIAWLSLDRAFAAPVDRADDVADYVPTQIIAELLKKHRFDGIVYRSQLGKGHNVALFDLDAAELTECHVSCVKSIELVSGKVS